MTAAGAALLGRHDFHSFETDWPNRTSSVRTILDLRVERIGSQRHDRGRGRRLPVQYGAVDRRNTRVGRLRQAPPEWVAEVLKAENRIEAGPTAPPQGLFLVAVRYAS